MHLPYISLAEQERRATTCAELREVSAARDALARQLAEAGRELAEARAEAERARRRREDSERTQGAGAAAGREAAEIAARSEEIAELEARALTRQAEAARGHDAREVAAREEQATLCREIWGDMGRDVGRYTEI